MALLLWGALSSAAFAEIEFYQSVDFTEVGIEDTIRLSVVITDAPANAQVKFPNSKDFETINRSESTQASFSLGGGGPGVMKKTQKYHLILRPTRLGNLTIPASVLTTPNKSYRTEAISVVVKKGRLRRGATNSRFPDPFRNFPFASPGNTQRGGEEEPEEGSEAPDVQVPRNDSDLFLRATLDKDEVYVGQQSTLSIYIYSRVDLSTVDQVSMPKLDGFWSEDLESPTQLLGEQKLINGIPYRAYLLKRRALFPVKAGKVKIDATEADITTGFLFAGHRLHRKSNELTLKVKPLPEPAPAGFSSTNVGDWRISAELSQPETELGQPVTVRITVEGRGNLKNLTLPPLTASNALKIYEPTSSDRLTLSGGTIGGKRGQEYLVSPQRTGMFTIPPVTLHYFNPRTERYEIAKTEPLSLKATPGASGATSLNPGASAAVGAEPGGQKNVLAAGGLKGLRSRAQFAELAPVPLWRRGFFVPALVFPFLLWAGLAVGGVVRSRLSHEDEGAMKSKKAKEAHKRLKEAQALKDGGNSADFYGEVERALLQFLEAKLGVPVGGLRREQLKEKMRDEEVPIARQREVLAVLDACAIGRFAPGAAGPEARTKALESAAAAMDAWERKS